MKIMIEKVVGVYLNTMKTAFLFKFFQTTNLQVNKETLLIYKLCVFTLLESLVETRLPSLYWYMQLWVYIHR